ncbi:thioredoxin domain-containing protein [bacterium]|nr:thioredoxin domain-containing protein [bacterium]
MKKRAGGLLLFAVVTTGLIAWNAPRAESRLAREKSPYLRQHADNLVDWYPWGPEAFERARKFGLPIFLSVGYSTCHWCHVMERESFMDPDIAKILNTQFVPIKVDREERPDVDAVYMNFLLRTGQGGGWPMSIFLTPEREPFLGGTYFPTPSQYGRPGFREVLTEVHQLWSRDRLALTASAGKIAQALRTVESVGDGSREIAPELLDLAYQGAARHFDREYGGFGSSPKFPNPSFLDFLLRYSERTNAQQSRQMVLSTLQSISSGGIHDFLEGGFHRYSTDRKWHVPHFEKMLYDQAMLAQVYLDAFALTGDSSYSRSAESILDYVGRRLSHPEGGFYSAEDADSEEEGQHREGAFYTWSAEQFSKALDPRDRELAAYHYGVSTEQAISPDNQELAGKYVLHQPHQAQETQACFSLSGPAWSRRLEKIDRQLLGARQRRARPQRDEKCVCAGNAQMITAFARAYRFLKDPRLLTRAEAAMEFQKRYLYDSASGELRHYYQDGTSPLPAFCDDYAELIAALLELHQVTQNVEYLGRATELQKKQLQLFWDQKTGGFYSEDGRDPSILLRGKPTRGSVSWDCNSRSALNLLRLAQFSDSSDYTRKAGSILSIVFSVNSSAPDNSPAGLCALSAYLAQQQMVVVAGPAGDSLTRTYLELALAGYHPNRTVLWADGGERQRELSKSLPFLREVGPAQGRPTVFICTNFTCGLPLTDGRKIRRALEGSPAVSGH